MNRRVRLAPWLARAIALALLAGCAHHAAPPAARLEPGAPSGAPSGGPRSLVPVLGARLAPIPTGAGTPGAPMADRFYPGTGGFIATPGAPAAPVMASGGEVRLNFADTDVREVARDVLGKLLHLTYVVDPDVKAKITLDSGTPLPRAAILPTLQAALRSAGLGLIRSGNVYRILSLKEAVKAGAPLALAEPVGQPAFGTRVFQLHYVSASELRRTLGAFIGTGSVVEADPTRNLLIASGPPDSLANLSAIVALLDVNWMRGMSFATFPLRYMAADDLAKQLTRIFDTADHGRLAGAVRIVPLVRQDMILVISTQASYLMQARNWVRRLDVRNPDATMHLYEYPVQNAQASDLARLLSRLLGTGGGGSEAAARTAPTTQPTLMSSGVSQGGAAGGAPGGSGLGGSSLSGATLAGGGQGSGGLGGGGLGTGGGGGAQAGGLSGSPVSPIAAASGLLGGGSGSGLPEGGGATAALSGGGAGASGIRIVADTRNNTLLFYARPAEYRMVQRLIRKLDVVPPEVKIDATIAEVTLNHNLQYGLQYFLKQGSGGATLSGLASGVVTSVFPGFNYAVMTGNQQIIISALAGITHVNVVSSPQVLVLDHQPAFFQVGAQVPVPIQQSQSQLVANAPLVSTIEYRNTGVILQVTPQVSSSGVVRLDIDQEVSDVAPTTSSALNAPTFNQRQIVSSVVVGDRETVALGGLISTTTDHSRNGIPLLMNLPYLGALFSTVTRTTTRTELLVLLTPRVIRDDFDARASTAELRKRLRLVAPLIRAFDR